MRNSPAGELKVYMHTVGCARNLVDSEILLGQMGQRVRPVEEGRRADLIVVNSCGFIEGAREESIDAVMEAVRLKQEAPGRRVVMMGCLSERCRDELRREIPELDGIYGVGEFGPLLREMGLRPSGSGAVQDPDRDAPGLFMERVLLSPRHAAYLRISDGCDKRCSYCSIPQMRGRMHSRPPVEILAEARSLVERGVKEINIIGQEISSYGRDLSGKPGICGLLKILNDCGAPWLRLLYTHPPLVDREFAETMADCEQVLPYLDFPVEHVSGHVLRRMHRAGDAVGLAEQMAMLREVVPGLVLRTSIIVGFPGERERDFEELLAFIREHPFDRLGAFIWSPEAGTPALDLPGRVPSELAAERFHQLMQAQQELSLAANEALLGRRERVLVDEFDDAAGVSLARSYRDALDIDNCVELEGSFPVGDFVDVEYVEALEYDLRARPLGSSGTLLSGDGS